MTLVRPSVFLSGGICAEAKILRQKQRERERAREREGGEFFPTIQQRIFPQQAHSVTREFEDAGKGREGEVGGVGGREGGRVGNCLV